MAGRTIEGSSIFAEREEVGEGGKPPGHHIYTSCKFLPSHHHSYPVFLLCAGHVSALNSVNTERQVCKDVDSRVRQSGPRSAWYVPCICNMCRVPSDDPY